MNLILQNVVVPLSFFGGRWIHRMIISLLLIILFLRNPLSLFEYAIITIRQTKRAYTYISNHP